jgi:beta-ribofuranosylaminobenzene 5'-phosphate synthase
MREGEGEGPALFVEAPARLHFGVLDLRGDLGRRFGGIGAAVPAPSLLVEACPAPSLTAEGPDAARVLEFARRFAAHHAVELRIRFRVHHAIPSHAGLGSGTQLALAVARAAAELTGLPTEVAALARAVDRGLRSAVGTWTFAHGGFVLEGGRAGGGADHGERVAPLLARLAFPRAWRCVVAVPRGKPGLAGDQEAAAFARLPAPDAREVERVAHLVLMQLLPALAEADLIGFGAALEEVQHITGGWFAPAQGGVFAPGETRDLVERLREWGAVGVGQSSWGPAVYGIVGDATAAHPLAGRVRGALGPGGAVYEGGFSPTGARVWRGDPSVSG